MFLNAAIRWFQIRVEISHLGPPDDIGTGDKLSAKSVLGLNPDGQSTLMNEASNTEIRIIGNALRSLVKF